MSDLKTLQAQFQACLIDDDQQIESSIMSTANFNVQDRLAVYADGYRLRLVDILAKEFPLLKLFCGEEKFDDAAFAYLDQHHSQHYSLYQFGKYFSEFLKSYYKNEPIITELAAFERALGDVLLAGNAQRIGVQALLDLTPEQWPLIKLLLHPAVQSLDLTLNVPVIWRALNAQQSLNLLDTAVGENKDEGYARDLLSTVESSPASYLIWRFHLQPYFRALTPQEMQIFSSIQRGDCFAQTCEDLMGHLAEEEIGGFVASVLQQWLTNGIFMGVEIAPAATIE